RPRKVVPPIEAVPRGTILKFRESVFAKKPFELPSHRWPNLPGIHDAAPYGISLTVCASIRTPVARIYVRSEVLSHARIAHTTDRVAASHLLCPSRNRRCAEGAQPAAARVHRPDQRSARGGVAILCRRPRSD